MSRTTEFRLQCEERAERLRTAVPDPLKLTSELRAIIANHPDLREPIQDAITFILVLNAKVAKAREVLHDFEYVR